MARDICCYCSCNQWAVEMRSVNLTLMYISGKVTNVETKSHKTQLLTLTQPPYLTNIIYVIQLCQYISQLTPETTNDMSSLWFWMKTNAGLFGCLNIRWSFCTSLIFRGLLIPNLSSFICATLSASGLFLFGFGYVHSLSSLSQSTDGVSLMTTS